jgi:hypothetical protein
VVIVDPERVENPGYQSPMNWTGRRRSAAECPQNGAESNLDGELHVLMVKTS